MLLPRTRAKSSKRGLNFKGGSIDFSPHKRTLDLFTTSSQSLENVEPSHLLDMRAFTNPLI